MPRWGELQLKVQSSASGTSLISVVAADPTGVAMNRVASTMRTIEDVAANRLAPAAATEVIRATSQSLLTLTWLFTLAVAAGAVALAVIFGVLHHRNGRGHRSDPQNKPYLNQRLIFLDGFVR
jgi:hypothetical protein